MFTESFRARLAGGKYTKWATTLSEPNLEGLLWMLGEFGYRSPALLKLLDQHPEEITHGGLARGRVALETISRIVLNGERIDAEEAVRRIQRLCGHLSFTDLPDVVKIATERASPETNWDFVIMSAEGFELGGKDPKDQLIGASVDRKGKVTLRTPMSMDQLPEAAIQAIKEQMPKFEVYGVHAVGPDCRTISHYELWVCPEHGQTQKILVSVDGKQVMPESK